MIEFPATSCSPVVHAFKPQEASLLSLAAGVVKILQPAAGNACILCRKNVNVAHACCCGIARMDAEMCDMCDVPDMCRNWDVHPPISTRQRIIRVKLHFCCTTDG